MKAIIQEKYGLPDAVLTLQEVATPVIKDDEVLVRVRAASVNADVWHAVTGLPYYVRLIGAGILSPKDRIPGTDLAGEVQSVGRLVTQFEPGDEVFGECDRRFVLRGGAYAEYAAVPHDTIVRKPAGITFEQAAAVPSAGLLALGNLGVARQIKPGHRVLINGAGGNVGSIAIQILKAKGMHVTGVDKTTKLELMRCAGADQVVDYTGEDRTRRAERYDFILDVASTLSVDEWKRMLAPTGIYWRLGHDHFGKRGGRIFGSGFLGIFGLIARSPFDRQLPKLKFSGLPTKKDCMTTLKQLIDEGKLTPMVDRAFPLSEASHALRRLEEGRNVGTIVITP